MWLYQKKLQYPVNITKKNLEFAKQLVTQYGGFAGELGAELAPENFTYTIGFIVGTFSFMFLRLFADKKE